MNYRMIAIPVLLVLLAAAVPVTAQVETPDFDRMLEDIDSLSDFAGRDFSGVYTIVSERPGEERNVTQARLFRRDETDQFLILILQPSVDRGQGYLQIDDTVWFYDPESRKFERSSLRENIQESDAQNDDLNRSSFADDYEVSDWRTGRLGAFDVYILDLVATNDDVSYEKVRLYVRQDVSLVLVEENFSVNDRLMRTVVYSRYATVDNKFVPSQVLIRDEINVGERTQYTLSDPSVASIPDYVFTRDYLERVNRQ